MPNDSDPMNPHFALDDEAYRILERLMHTLESVMVGRASRIAAARGSMSGGIVQVEKRDIQRAYEEWSGQ